MNGTPYVWGSFLHHPLRILHDDGEPLGSLLANLPFDLEDLARPGYRVAWRDAVTVTERLRDRLGEDLFVWFGVDIAIERLQPS